MFRTDLKQFKKEYMNEVLRFLTEGKEEWTYQSGTKPPVTFNQALMTPMEKT